MDLQMSLFEVSDLYTAVLSKRDPTVLQHVIDTYHPTFVLVSAYKQNLSGRSRQAKEKHLSPHIPG